MTIKNKDAYMAALWDWGFLDDCFASGIKVSDVDGIVERKGHALFIEAKPPGKNVSVGQRILFERLAGRGFTVLVIWGETNAPEVAQLYYPWRDQPGERFAADTKKIHEVVRDWYVWANQEEWT